MFAFTNTWAFRAQAAFVYIGAILVFCESALAGRDPLSLRPLVLTEKHVSLARAAYRHSLISNDQNCALTSDAIASTELLETELPFGICTGRTNELVYIRKNSALVACSKDQPDFAMRVSIGANGLGKTTEGSRQSPVGTYWIGRPRHSTLFGIFIPVGYPNLSDIKKGYTGSSIGIHGPERQTTCHPEKSLEKNWTDGCFAVARDSQIIALSEWVMGNWPVRLTVTRN